MDATTIPVQARTWRGYLATVAFVAVATAIGALGRRHLALPDFVMLYLLTIMLAATLFGRGPSLVAATLSVLAYDFFFIPPFFTFVVEDERHILTFAVMFVVGLLISGLTLRVRRHERDAYAGKVLTQRQILEDVWGRGHADQTHYLRVFMAQLRRKIEDDPARPRLLVTEPGVGYRLRDRA